MKNKLAIWLIVLGILIISSILIYSLINRSIKEDSSERCARLNETCGGGIQGPNGESSYINCCQGLVCNHTYFGGYSELGICFKES